MKLKAVGAWPVNPLSLTLRYAQRAAVRRFPGQLPPSFSFIGLYYWVDGAGSRVASVGARWNPPLKHIRLLYVLNHFFWRYFQQVGVLQVES